MKLTDLLPLEKWIKLEKEFFEKTGLSASVFDVDGIRITDYKTWSNKLCPVIKAIPKGQTYICAAAHQNAAAMAQKAKGAVVEECDAGLLKIAVPIYSNGEFLGIAGGCGLLPENGEIESFLINKLTDIDEDEIEKLSKGIPELSMEKAEAIGALMKQKLDEMLS